jgi:hypothetical protein
MAPSKTGYSVMTYPEIISYGEIKTALRVGIIPKDQIDSAMSVMHTIAIVDRAIERMKHNA